MVLYASFREGELDLFYYSCKDHLDELIEVLRKHGDDEEELLTTFEERYDEIIRHMNVTQDLYAEKQGLYVRPFSMFIIYFYISIFSILPAFERDHSFFTP